MKFQVEYTRPGDGALETITLEAEDKYEVEDLLEDQVGRVDIVSMEVV